MELRWKRVAAACALACFLVSPAVCGAGLRESGGKVDTKKLLQAGMGAAALAQLKLPKRESLKAAQEAAAPQSKAEKKAAKKAEREWEAALAEARTDSLAKVRKMAEAGDLQAAFILGCAYYTGRQIGQDDAQAVAWWKKAAVYGHPDADAYAGLSFAEGFGGSPRSREEALRRYRRAAQNGSALGSLLLGIELYKSPLTKEREAALPLFRCAAAKGEAQAKRFLQVILQEGIKKPRDFGRGIDWRDEVKKTPLTALYTQAGINALRGNIVKQDSAAAVRWWEFSAAQEDAGAQALLGTAYYTGRGVGKDEKKAVLYLKAAAAKEEPLAQYTLGKAYLAGNSVKRNKELAAKLLRAAGDAGIADAKKLADRLEGRET